jgi:selenocysteine lyase/cysteine desulfurase
MLRGWLACPRGSGGAAPHVSERCGWHWQDVVADLHAARIQCRCGHMYAYRLLDSLGLDMSVRAPSPFNRSRRRHGGARA